MHINAYALCNYSDMWTAPSPEYQVWLQGKSRVVVVTSNLGLPVHSGIVMYVTLGETDEGEQSVCVQKNAIVFVSTRAQRSTGSFNE